MYSHILDNDKQAVPEVDRIRTQHKLIRHLGQDPAFPCVRIRSHAGGWFRVLIFHYWRWRLQDYVKRSASVTGYFITHR
jgi:hypothetical protein